MGRKVTHDIANRNVTTFVLRQTRVLLLHNRVILLSIPLDEQVQVSRAWHHAIIGASANITKQREFSLLIRRFDIQPPRESDKCSICYSFFKLCCLFLRYPRASSTNFCFAGKIVCRLLRPFREIFTKYLLAQNLSPPY